MPRLKLFPLFFVLWLALVNGASGGDLSVPDLREIQNESFRLVRAQEETEHIAARARRDAQALEQSLARDEAELATGDVTLEMLRQARLDLDSLESRLAVVRGRLDHRRMERERLGQFLEQLAAELAEPPQGGAPLTAERIRRQAAEGLLREQREALDGMIGEIRDLEMAWGRLEELHHQRLRLLQGRLGIAALQGAASASKDERAAMMQRVIADFLEVAVRTERAADRVQGDSESARAHRQALRLRADEAVNRGFLRQLDLEILEAGSSLDALAALRDDDTMPLRLVRQGLRELDQIAATAARVGDDLETQKRIQHAKLAASRRAGDARAAHRETIADLRTLMDFQARDLAALNERIAAERTEFDRVIAESQSRALFLHRPLPRTANEWDRVAASALRLPWLVLDSLRWLTAEMRWRLAAAPWSTHALLWVGAPALIALVLWGARRLRRAASLAPEEGRQLAITLAALAHALPAAIPAGLWALIALAVDLPPRPMAAVLALLSLWPILVFALRLARLALLGGAPAAEVEAGAAEAVENVTEEAGPEPASEPVPEAGIPAVDRRFFVWLRMGMLVSAAIAVVYVLVHALPLSPLLADVLDRLAMGALLVLTIPALALRGLVSRRAEGGDHASLRAWRFAARLARVLPVFVLVTGAVGLAGFVNLAWTLTGYFLWLLVVSLGLYFVIGLLRDLQFRLAEGFDARDPERAAFWRTHFMEPGYRLGLLAAVAGGGWLLFELWGWSSQTPLVRWVLGVFETVLFELGGAPFTLGDVLISLLLVGAALWVGGWSQQVSYQLAYRKVRDLGLRQALATFTQYVVIVAGVLLALKIIGFDLTTLTVFMASLGVGIGFGLQNIVNNFISGVLLLAERPLKLGDYVTIGANEGNVTQIGIRSLAIRTPDKKDVVIPNGNVISGDFTNWTRGDDTVRQVHYLRIRFDSDRERAMEIAREVLAEDPGVLKFPEPGVFLWEYTEQGVKLRVQFCVRFVHGPGSFAVRSTVLTEIGRRFAAEGIRFAESALPEQATAPRM